MKKARKNENHQNSFDNSIKNHMYMPETGGQVVWSDLDALKLVTECMTINLVLLQSGLMRDILWWISLFFQQKTNDLS